MATVPQLKIFYVDLIEDKSKAEGKRGLAKATAHIADSIDNAKEIMDPLNKDIKPKAIKSEEELTKYHNPLGNSWVESDRIQGIKQLYIRHPKRQYSHLLIEAEHFYDYIEDEYYNELYNYILSHCSPTLIKVDKKAKSSLGINIAIDTKKSKPQEPMKKGRKLVKKELDNYATLDYSRNRGNYMALQFKRSPHVQPLPQYVWLEKSLMTAINGLTKGARLSKRVEVKNSFGLTSSMAKRIGLNVSSCKDYELKIYIEC